MIITSHGFPLIALPFLSSSQVKLLKDVLEEWKKEVEKKPPEMSVDQAYDTLGLPTGVGGSVVVFMPVPRIFRVTWV